MTEISIDRSHYPPLAKEIESWQRGYTPGPLTEEEFYQFFQDGFVIKNNLFQPEQLKPVVDSIGRVVDDLAQELYQGVRSSSFFKNVYWIY